MLMQLAGCAFPMLCNETPGAGRNAGKTYRALRVTPFDEPYDVVTVARTEGALVFHVETHKLCQTDVLEANRTSDSKDPAQPRPLELKNSRRGPCSGPPLSAGGLDIGLQAGPRLMLIGTTSETGEFTLPLSQLDRLFADTRVEPQATAQVLVHGLKVAELPLGEIANRKELVDATLTASNQALAMPDTPRERLETLLAEIMSLRQQGIDDPRLLDGARLLHERLQQPASVVPATETATATTTATAITTDPVSVSSSQDFDRAFDALPSMCKITIQGGAIVVGALVPESIAVGFMLGAISATIGDDLTQWLTNRCCEMAASSVLHAESTVCNTASTDVQVL